MTGTLLIACTTASPPTRHDATPPSMAASVPTSSSGVAASDATAPTPTTSAPANALGPTGVIGAVIALNPGHDGANSSNPAAMNALVPAGFGETKACDTAGTSTDAGYPEHAFNWDVALGVQSILKAAGVTVIMTRTSDSGFGPCVDERARIANAAQAVISIHADGADATGHGFHVCEALRQPAGAAVAGQSHSLTVALHDALLAGSGMSVSSYYGTNGYVVRDDFAALNLATVPSTFLEIGNMRNASDAAIQSSDAGRQQIARAVANGILSWLSHR